MKKKVFIIGFICTLLDQLTKLIITKCFELNTGKIIIDNFFSLLYIRNTGAAWGILSNNTILLIIISLIFLGAFIYFIKKTNVTKMETYSYGLILGGIVGNLLDRIVRGYVVDFFNFKIFNYNYPVFNVADIFIVVGVILIIIEEIIKYKKSK